MFCIYLLIGLAIYLSCYKDVYKKINDRSKEYKDLQSIFIECYKDKIWFKIAVFTIVELLWLPVLIYISCVRLYKDLIK